MILKPQDLFITLKLVSLGAQPWSYVILASELFMSASEINAGVKRAIRARLLSPGPNRNDNPKPVVMALEEFIIHGLKYAFPPDRGTLTRGMLTSSAASPLAEISPHPDSMPPVWPHPKGRYEGYAFSPLYRSAPEAAMVDPYLYELLTLVDTIRDERSRERNLAAAQLRPRLKRAQDEGSTE